MSRAAAPRPRAVPLALAAALVAAVCVLVGTAAAAPRDPAEAQKLVLDSEILFRRALDDRTSRGRFHLADEAATIALRALALDPDSLDARLARAQALAVSDPEHPERCRPECDQAIQLLEGTRLLDKRGIEGRRVAYELGILYSRKGRHVEALAEYDRALKLVMTEGDFLFPLSFYEEVRRASQSSLHTNSAESLMAMGRLDEALARYRKAEELAQAQNLQPELELAQAGLAVALDRDGQSGRAEEVAQRLLTTDPSMAALTSDSVFFEPAGDVQYYLALGRTAAYHATGLGLDRDEALAAWSRFLTEQPHSPYAARARARKQLLERERPSGPQPHPAVVATLSPFGNLQEDGRRSPAEVQVLLDKGQAGLTLCYARALRKDPTLDGWMELALLLSDYGGVQAQILNTFGLSSTGITGCFEKVIGQWRVRPIRSGSPGRPAAALVRLDLVPAP